MIVFWTEEKNEGMIVKNILIVQICRAKNQQKLHNMLCIYTPIPLCDFQHANPFIPQFPHLLNKNDNAIHLSQYLSTYTMAGTHASPEYQLLTSLRIRTRKMIAA